MDNLNERKKRGCGEGVCRDAGLGDEQLPSPHTKLKVTRDQGLVNFMTPHRENIRRMIGIELDM